MAPSPWIHLCEQQGVCVRGNHRHRHHHWHSLNKSRQRPHTSAKENMIWIQSLYPDTDSGSGLLSKFKGDFLVQGCICGKIFTKIRYSFRRYKPNCGKTPYLTMLKNPSKNSWIRIRRRKLPKFNQFFLVYRYVCRKFFMKIRSVDFT